VFRSDWLWNSGAIDLRDGFAKYAIHKFFPMQQFLLATQMRQDRYNGNAFLFHHYCTLARALIMATVNVDGLTSCDALRDGVWPCVAGFGS
jgi:hypothetical protein